MATEGQQHPLKIYFWIWGLLFLFSAFIAIFMHMAWERVALIWAILGPPALLLFLIGFMVYEGDYTEVTRVDSFTAPPEPEGLEHH